MPFVPECAAVLRVLPDGCLEYVRTEVGCEVSTRFELFHDCSHRMAFVLVVLILQFSGEIYHNISASSVVVIWTRTFRLHVLAFELGHGGDQWSQHSPQSRRDSNWIRCLCACETLSIHRPSTWGEEWLINCFLAVKEIHIGTDHFGSRSFAQEKILHYLFFFFCGDLSKEV